MKEGIKRRNEEEEEEVVQAEQFTCQSKHK